MKADSTGILTVEELREIGRYPSEERMQQGPIAVAECTQNIPCNPCETSCPFQAITIGERITSLPVVDGSKCVGCATCVTACSGQAIFIVDKSFSKEVGTVSFPYEYLVRFRKDDIVKCANRAGEYVCDGKVKRVVLTKKADHCYVVTLEVPIDMVDEVRSVYRTWED